MSWHLKYIRMLTAMYMCVLGNNTNFETGSTYTGSTTMVDSYMEDLSKKIGGGHLPGSAWTLAWGNMAFTVLWSRHGLG